MRSRPGGGTRAVALAGSLALALACSSAEERAREQLERGREYAAAGRFDEARLELLNASLSDAVGVEARRALAEIEIDQGELGAALVLLREANRLDPDDRRVALSLAGLIMGEESAEAKRLIEGAVAADPEDPAGYIARSQLALSSGSRRAALQAARMAIEKGPDDPEADFQLGLVLEATIRKGQLRETGTADTVYESAWGAFEGYVEKGGERPWKARLEQARVLAAWPGRATQAARQFRVAIEEARESGSRRDLLVAASRAAAFARKDRDDELEREALETLVETEPRDYSWWRALAEIERRKRRDPDAVWRRALAARPDDPRAHIEYARFLISRWKLDEALAHLEGKAAEGIAPPILLTAVSSTQLAARRVDDARATVERLEAEHPDHPRTRVARAQLLMRQGKVGEALELARALTAEHDDYHGLIFLARAEIASGDPEAAFDALRKASGLHPVFPYEAEQARAQLEARQGDCPAAIRRYERIAARIALSSEDNLVLARCHYRSDEAVAGRKILEEILENPAAPSAAILEYARREAGDPAVRTRMRRSLEFLLRREPRNWEVLSVLTRIDLADDRAEEALARLDEKIDRAGDRELPEVRLLRAQVAAEAGRDEGRLQDALIALRAKPKLRNALEISVALLLEIEKPKQALEAAEFAKRNNAISPERQLLLGQLYRMNDRHEEAVAVFEKAVRRSPENPNLHLQLGLALEALNRQPEAVAAFEKALAISTTFPGAEHARRALEGARGNGAS